MSQLKEVWGEAVPVLANSPILTAVIASILFGLIYLNTGPLSKIPGPLVARWSPLWLLYHVFKRDMHRASIDIHKKYGKVVRTGFNEVSVSDLTAISTIYGAGNKYHKGDFYSALQGKREWDIFPERDEKKHSRNRKQVSRFYSLTSVKQMEPSIDATIDAFVDKLRTQAGMPLDMSVWIQLFAFDVIGEVTFSKPFGYIAAGRDVDGAFGQVERALDSASWLGQVPRFFEFVQNVIQPLLLGWSPLGASARNGSILRFALRAIDDRIARDDSVDRTDFLSHFMAAHRARPDEMPHAGIVSASAANVGAGSDTTAISIGAVLYYLCRNPRTMAKLLDEIRETASKAAQAEAADGASHSSRNFTLDAALNMPYLQACLVEAMRLHPAVGMTLPRVVPAGGLHVASDDKSKNGGYFLPAGTTVGANAWVVHRDPTAYGPDPDAFRPERWLEGDSLPGTPRRAAMDRYFLTFGGGARVCLGRHLSLMEMSKLVPRLLLEFDLELAGGDLAPAWRERCAWFVKQRDWRMVLTPRAEV